MTDYSVSGAFGEVKIWNTCVPSNLFQSVDHISHIGWHKVNDKYQINRPGGTNHDMLIMTISGQGHIRIGDNEYIAAPGSVAVIPRNLTNAYGGVKDDLWEFHWINYCGTHANACTDDIVQRREYLFDIGQKDIRLLVRTLTDESAKGVERELAESAALSRILHTLLKASAALQYSHSEPERAVIHEIILLLENNVRSDFCLDTLAEHLHYSKEHIIRLFKNATGMTPYRYWRFFRYKQLCVALESSVQSIGEISAEFGYRSISSFSKQFKEFSGLSPTEYRKLYGLYQN